MGPWNDSTDRQLLLTIIHLNAPRVDWKQVAAVMGEGFTDRSTSQHYAKIKKEFEQLITNAAGAVGPPGGSASKGTTPKKGAPTKKTAPSGGKRKKFADADDDEDDEGTDRLREDTPAKKPKKVKVKNEPKYEPKDELCEDESDLDLL